MKLRCIKTEGRDYLTVGRIYHAYFTEWRDLFTEADDSYNEKDEYKQLPEDKRWGHGPAPVLSLSPARRRKKPCGIIAKKTE